MRVLLRLAKRNANGCFNALSASIGDKEAIIMQPRAHVVASLCMLAAINDSLRLEWLIHDEQ